MVYWIASFIIYYITHWIFLDFPKFAVWVYTILSAVLSIFSLGILFVQIYDKKLGVKNEISDYWRNRDKPMKKGMAVLSILPLLLIAIVLAVGFYLSFDNFISALKNKTWEAEALIPLVMCWIFAIVFFVVYFLTMWGAYSEISCEYCNTVGYIDFSKISQSEHISVQNKSRQYDEKVGTLQVDNQDVANIYAKKTEYYQQQTTTTTKVYQGVCWCCKRKNTRKVSEYDIKNI